MRNTGSSKKAGISIAKITPIINRQNAIRHILRASGQEREAGQFTWVFARTLNWDECGTPIPHIVVFGKNDAHLVLPLPDVDGRGRTDPGTFVRPWRLGQHLLG